MFRFLHRRPLLRWLLPALAALLLWPLAADAAWLGLRNDLTNPVVIQSSSVVNNVVRRGRPRLLYPGEVTWDGIVQPGAKIIEVYDAKGRTLLYKNQVRCGGDDLFYSLRADTAARKPVTMTPAKMPKETPGSSKSSSR